MRAQGQHIGDVLVRANHHQRALLAVNATQIEDVDAALGIRAEDFFMVDQAVTPQASKTWGSPGRKPFRWNCIPILLCSSCRVGLRRGKGHPIATASDLPCIVICHCHGSPRQTRLPTLPLPS